MTSPDPTPRQIIVFVLYSVLCLPASMTVAGYAATRITQNVSNFEGGAGYAALWWIIVLTCVFCGLSIALFALLRKRIAILAAITVGLAVLSVPPTPTVAAEPKNKRPDLAIGPFGFRWWSGGGSNSRPSHCERDALPAELPPQQSTIIHTHFCAWQ